MENPGKTTIPLWVKLGAGAAILVLLLVVGGVLTLILTVKKSVSNRYVAFETAVKNSPKFNVPVTVDVGRYAYWDNDSSGSQQEATPAAYTLAQMGLVYIHTGLYSDVSANYDNRGRMVIDSSTGLVPRQYRHIDLEWLGSAKAQSTNWETYEVKRDGKVGWKVPTGDREFLHVMEAGPGTPGATDDILVTFTWRWKPNELGQGFDKASPSYVTANKPKTSSRSSFDFDVDDSRAVYWGTADLRRVGETWEVGVLTWSGSQVRLSNPNDPAEIDRMLREAQNSR